MGGAHNIREVLEIARKIRPDAKIVYKNAPAAINPYPSSYDDSAAREEIGWKPDYSIEEAAKEHLSIVNGA